MDLYYGTLYWNTTGTSALRLTPREPASRYDAIVVGGGMSGA